MALTDDQKAMLRLLAQREEGYEDMAAVMGISVEEVRERVKEALAEVDQPEPVVEPESEPEPPVAPAPPPAAPKAEEPPAPLAPTAEQPAPTAKAPATPAASSTKRASQLPSFKMPKDRGALIGLGAGALALVILVIVLIVGGDGDSSSNATTAQGSLAENVNAPAENENLTQAILSPPDGGDASGRALLGRYKKSVLLQVEAEGLDPAPAGESYTVWLYSSPKIALRLGAVAVDDSGKIATQIAIPTQLLSYVASGAFDQVDISLTSNAEYKAVLAKAKKERALPPYTGESVLRGEISGPAIQQQ